jgi:hypothetical protein
MSRTPDEQREYDERCAVLREQQRLRQAERNRIQAIHDSEAAVWKMHGYRHLMDAAVDYAKSYCGGRMSPAAATLAAAMFTAATRDD